MTHVPRLVVKMLSSRVMTQVRRTGRLSHSVDPLAYLTATLKAIVNGHKQSYRLSVTMGLYRKARTRSRIEPLGLHSP